MTKQEAAKLKEITASLNTSRGMLKHMTEQAEDLRDKISELLSERDEYRNAATRMLTERDRATAQVDALGSIILNLFRMPKP